jgi:hypothetical protein
MTMAIAGACSQEKSAPLTPASGKAEPSASEAIRAVARAQCEYEQRCGRVGPDKEFSSWDHCMKQADTKLRDSLSDCKKRVDEGDVRECVGEIEERSCGNVMDELGTFIACSTDDLCD